MLSTSHPKCIHNIDNLSKVITRKEKRCDDSKKTLLTMELEYNSISKNTLFDGFNSEKQKE